jgi:hypothetical protein
MHGLSRCTVESGYPLIRKLASKDGLPLTTGKCRESTLSWGLFVEPYIFHAPAVE